LSGGTAGGPSTGSEDTIQRDGGGFDDRHTPVDNFGHEEERAQVFGRSFDDRGGGAEVDAGASGLDDAGGLPPPGSAAHADDTSEGTIRR